MIFYDNILKRAREKQVKEGISYPEKDGKLYNTFKFFYVVAFIFGNVMNLFYILGMLIAMTDNAHFSGNAGNVIAVAVCVVLLIGALIMSKFNDNLIIASIFGAINLGSATGLLLIFMKLMSDDTVAGGIKLNFYWRHLDPLAILAICAVAMSLIVVTAYFKTKKAYNKVMEIVFEEYNALADNEKPEWEDYIKNYKF